MAFNLCRVIVDVLRERLSISGFTGSDAAGVALAAQVWEWWEAAGMATESITEHRRALRDAMGYLIVDWNAARKAPRWKANSRYDGDTGVTFHTNANGVPIWPSSTGGAMTSSKPTMARYGARSICRIASCSIARTLPARTAGGRSIRRKGRRYNGGRTRCRRAASRSGLACTEFKNPSGESELEAIIGLQNALNKLVLDMLAAGDATGFQMLAVSYKQPLGVSLSDEDDETADDLRIAPGRIIELGDDATITTIPPGDLSQILKALNAVTGFIAASTRTPQYYLQPFGGSDVPSGEALKQLESALVSRATERQAQFAASWVEAMRVGARLWLAMGGSGIDAEAPLTVSWDSPAVRNELYDMQVATGEAALGIPQEVLWQRRLGYSPEDVEEFKRSAAHAEARKLATVLGSLNLGNTDTGTTTSPRESRPAGSINGGAGVGDVESAE